jgi:hypothetical protein
MFGGVMRYPFVLIICILALAQSAKASDDTTRVLFIGNSMTYFNNMPNTFRDISNNLGKKVKVAMYAPGGTGFVNHVSDPAVYAMFRQSWDVVVLQPGTNESAGTSASVNTTIARGKVLMDSIKKYSACARIYLYQIPYSVPSPSTWSSYFSVQTMFRDSVGKMADSMKVQMIAAGECARAYYRRHQNFALHTTYNDIHPGPLGSYLVACAAYVSVFQDSVKSCTEYAGIHQDSARKFFAISDTVILRHKASWRINTYNLHAGFSHSLSGTTLTFTNTSTHFTNLLWKFGDGTTSALLNPQHSYNGAGTYTVTLLATNATCTDSTQRTVLVLGPTGISESENNSASIFPNPATHHLTIKSKAMIVSLKLFDVSGKELSVKSNTSNLTELELSGLEPGVYFLEINSSSRIRFVKTGSN